MNAPKFSYDKLGDTLYIAFSPGEKAIGIELTDDILLRIHPTEHRAIGMTFFGVSYLWCCQCLNTSRKHFAPHNPVVSSTPATPSN